MLILNLFFSNIELAKKWDLNTSNVDIKLVQLGTNQGTYTIFKYI